MKVSEPTQSNKDTNLSEDELKQLTDFFQILIKIDQRKREKQCQ